MGIVWLASYPKSGNTWVRSLLTAYLGDDAVRIDALGHSNPLVTRRWFDDVVGLSSGILRLDEIERYRPACSRLLADAIGDELRFMKVHAANVASTAGERLFAPEAGAAVYIARNPLDVAASMAPFFGWPVERAVDVLCDESWVLNDAAGAMILPDRLTSWSGHVTSWLDAPGQRVHLVRYEDLHADAAAVLTGILGFAGVTPVPGEVAAAVEATRFERLREQEAERGFPEHTRKATAPFFRSGVVGAWRRELPPRLAGLVVQRHREAMVRLGYGDLVAEVERAGVTA